MSAIRIVGVDPGGRTTGVVGREGPKVLFVELIERSGGGDLPDAAYLNDVVDAIAAGFEFIGSDRLGVEGINAPQWYIRGEARPITKSAAMGLIGTGMAFGSVLSTFPHAVIVAPGKNGSAPLRAYPRELVGGPHNARWPRAEPRGEGKLRHGRSAWDIAGQARITRN